MRTIRTECDNVDSCTPGTSHLYPAPGTIVTVLVEQDLHVRGQDNPVTVPVGWAGAVLEIDPEGHHVVCPVLINGEHHLTYVPIDDIEWPDRAELVEEE